MKNYLLSYKIGQYEKPELEADNAGGCDSFVFVSIVREIPDKPFEGAKSFAILTADGATGDEVPPSEVFQAFVHLGQVLMRDERLPFWQRRIAEMTAKAVQRFFKTQDARRKN